MKFEVWKLRVKERFSLYVIALCLPFIVWGISGILPTFDDYTTLQSPQFTPVLSSQLLPTDGFWRPFDYLFGCLLGRHTWLFPVLNHVVIIVGHTISALLVYKICSHVVCNHVATNLATLFFFFSPAMLGTTLAVDGLNQTFAQLWGLLALLVYLTTHGRCVGGHVSSRDTSTGCDVRTRRLLLWPLCVVLAALSKENGLAWAIVPPIFAYAFQIMSRRTTIRHLAVGVLIAVGYAVARLLLNTNQTIGEDYLATTLADHVKDVVQLLAYTWVPVDYASIVYPPARNWPLAILTLLLATPFLLFLAVRGTSLLRSKKLPLLLLCFLILASPHLLTLTSIMHNYAPLAIAAVIVAVIIAYYIPHSLHHSISHSLILSFSSFLLAAIITDIHHFQATFQSGRLSRQMAMETIKKTGEKANNVFCISIVSSDDVPGYSSFYVSPVNAFAWGLSVRRYTDYQWPETITDTVISNVSQVKHIADSVFQTNTQFIWIVDNKKNDVTVIENK